MRLPSAATFSELKGSELEIRRAPVLYMVLLLALGISIPWFAQQLRETAHSQVKAQELRRLPDVDSQWEQARALKRVGKHDQALSKYEQALSERGSAAGAILNEIAVELLATGRSDEAISTLRRAIEKEPGLFAAYNNLSLALEANGDHEGAREVLLRAKQIQPKNEYLNRRLAVLSGSL